MEILLFILVISLNLLVYWIKFILKNHGYPVGWFWKHNRDIPNMFHLAKQTNNKPEKRKYYVMVVGLICGEVAVFSLFLVVVYKAMINS